jgi:hypothetical protein
MNRRAYSSLANLVVRLSLAASVLVVVLWARSGLAGEAWTVSAGRWTYMVRSDWGRLAFAAMEDWVPSQRFAWQRSAGGLHDMLPGRPLRSPPEVLGVRYRSGTFTYSSIYSTPPGALVTGRYVWLRVYHGHALLLALLPTAAVLLPRLRARLRTRLRASTGRCVSCGYDLRAGHDRCPECGASPAAPVLRTPGARAG